MSLPLLIFFVLLLAIPYATPFSFKKSRFDPIDASIVYEGGAYATVGTIEFTSSTYQCQVGHATYSRRVPIWDPKTRKLADLESHFTFYIDRWGRSSYAAGLAFFMSQPDFHIPPNSAGGFLGLYNLTTSNSARNQIVHLEFDTFPNPEWDPPFQHVGINNNSVYSANYTSWNATLHSGETADVWIIYDSATKNLSVSWKYQQPENNATSSTSLSYIVDLRDSLPPLVKVGFTAATSGLVERNVVESWEFHSSLEISELNVDNNSTKIASIVGPTVASGLVIAAVLSIAFIWRKKRQRKKQRRKEEMDKLNLTSINNELERGAAGPRRFSYEELASATSNFSKERKLGEGGFGEVYRGYLNVDPGSFAAIKKISRGSKQGRKEYITEVKVISMLRHRNLVQLIGWCHDRGDRYVIHRDIKPSNIMLDSSFNAKLGDFGLARLMDHEMGMQTTGLAGTLGYLAPEYVRTGRASKESDVYSFGIVAVEIGTGRKGNDLITEKGEVSLVEWVWELYGSGDLMIAVDERVRKMGMDDRQVETLMVVGLWCAHPDRNMRPSIRQAIQVLNFEAPLPELPGKMPVALYRVATPPLVSSAEAALVSNNTISSITPPTSLLFFLLFHLLLSPAAPFTFNKSRFDKDDTSILCSGGAAVGSGTIKLTRSHYGMEISRVIYDGEIPLWDSTTGELSDFTTHFSFSISAENTYASGIAFFLAPVGFQTPENSAGGYMGLYNYTDRMHLSPPEKRVVHVEFDYFVNPASRSVTQPEPTISPSPGSTRIRIVGLGLYGEQELLSWDFSSDLEMRESSSLKKKLVGMVALLAGIAIAANLTAYCFLKIWKMKKKEKSVEKEMSMTDEFSRGAGPRKFAYSDLVSATNNFSVDWKLGEGGFGSVYKGYLRDSFGTLQVAVKRISKGSRQGIKEYITEVMIISRLRHRNLVQLIGWCHDKDELLLVYQFMPNGSLDTHLFGNESCPIPWPLRYKIVMGLASALLYLHHEWDQCVVHRDIKAANVMLDSNFNVKLGDFGLARLVDHELITKTTKVAGTIGYMSPEYISTGRASKESDVFSFGVVCLEIATGRRVVDYIEPGLEMGFVEWVWDLYGTGKLYLAIDRRLTDLDEKEMECLMVVGLWCAHPDCTQRASIRQAIQVLKFEAALPNLPEKKPIPVFPVHVLASMDSLDASFDCAEEPLISGSVFESEI
ncbi:L-type lectin-domain containing receptor kinase IX.1 [Linum grandiflorum]